MRVLMVDSKANVKSFHEALALKNVYPDCEVHFAYLGLPSMFPSRFSHFVESACRKINVKVNFLKNQDLLPRANPYEKVTVVWSLTKLRKLIDSLEPDVIHTCDLYQNFLNVKQVKPAIPIVHDAEDLVATDKTYLQKTHGSHYARTLLEIERKVLLSADGIVFPSEREYETLGYSVDNKINLFPFVSKSTVIHRKAAKLSEEDGAIHVVYIGSIWRGGYRDILDYLLNVSQVANLHIYLSNYWHRHMFKTIKRLARSHQNLHLHPPIPFNRVTETIHVYDYGIVPYPDGYLKMKLTFGMKTLEYLYANILPLFRANGLMSNLNNKKKIGYVLKDIGDIPKIDKEKERQLLNNFDREYHLMETHIANLYRLYQQVAHD